jgi:hypothetical protein
MATNSAIIIINKRFISIKDLPFNKLKD